MIQSIFSPLQSKACITFEFITRRVLSIQEDPYQAQFWNIFVTVDPFFSLPFPLSTKPPAPHPKIWSKYICPSRSKPVWEVSLAHTLPRAGARDASAFKSRKGMYLYFSNSGSYGRQIILNYFQPKGTFRKGNGVITKKLHGTLFSNPKLVILGDFLAKRIWQI